MLASCGGTYGKYHDFKDPVDQPSDLTRQDYINQLMPKSTTQQVTVEAKDPPVPTSADLLLEPQKPRLGINKTVSLSVTEDVPLKDVFIELARLADIDIEIDPSIEGGVIFKAKNRPFDEVVQRICDLAGLRYSVNNGVLRIEADKPYVEDYQASFLNLIRKGSGRTDIDTKLLGSDQAGSSSGGTGGSTGGNSGGGGSGSSSSQSATGSQSSIESKSGGEGDIWNSIDKEITAIINNNSAPAARPGQAGAPSGGPDSSKFVQLNREAGIISVKTTAKNHEKIREYLSKVKNFYSSQVLIEAKVLEVALNDEFRSGVNWSVLSKSGHGLAITLPSVGSPPSDLTTQGGNLSTISLVSGDLTAAVKLAQLFGTTKTLSSPRILVMNNQQAVLSFATNETYFSISCSQGTTTTGSINSISQASNSITSTPHTIPIGIILNLQSSIDTKNNEVIMNVHPTLSRLTGLSVQDPAVSICAAQAANSGTGNSTIDLSNITSSIPQVDVREMDSILRLKSGEIMAIGGMIDQKNNNQDTGIPWVEEIPVLGNAFKTVDKSNQTVQTVIFLKATIVPGYGVDAPDQTLYNKFNNDPRPLSF